MKNLIAFFFLTVLALSGNSYAQSVPFLINYQGVARQQNGDPYSNQRISIKINLLDSTGPSDIKIVYSETSNITTSNSGLFNVVIGDGTASSSQGSFANINWSVGLKLMQVFIDVNGGFDFIEVSRKVFSSVPYALAVPPVGLAGGDLSGIFPAPNLRKGIITLDHFTPSAIASLVQKTDTSLMLFNLLRKSDTATML